ncbi:MAG: hypothetical protein AAF329_12855 [Cyanobacteria bacterium P01_A01_bin.17]
MPSGWKPKWRTLCIWFAHVAQGGRPQDNAWFRLGDELTFVGKAAQVFLDYNSFKEDKCLKAAERIAGALGAMALWAGL